MAYKYTAFNSLSSVKQNLLNQAAEIINNCYNIYSNYSVAAALITKSGKIYRSCNFENASYGLSICAEPGVLQSAFSMGDCLIECIAVIGGFADHSSGEPPMPCGRCRQLISEASFISGKNIDIVASNLDFSTIIETNIEYLLPAPFNLKNLQMVDKIESYKLKCKNYEL